MWVGLRSRDRDIIAHYVGILMVSFAGAMLIPLLTALVAGEWDPALDYVCGIGVAAGLGGMLASRAPWGVHLDRQNALVVTALVWLAASLVGAVPLALSGHYGSFLDALFDAMSGFTTSGLTLVQDLDHLPLAHNMWRHLTHLIGGQGIVVAVLTLAFGVRGGGAVSLYQAEGRDERILPNVMHTARFIWFVTLIYVSLGTAILSVGNLLAGMELGRAVLHGFWHTIACYDTGGFAPQSQNALYYHSPLFEIVTVMLMLAGMLNFNLHADIWRGDRRELFRNIESRTLAVHIGLLSLAVGLGLGATALYSEPGEVLRKGLYHLLSAHSGTGQQTLYAAQWTRGYGDLALVAVMLAMALGGMASSTAGGIKALRAGLIFKGLLLRIKQAIAPQSAIVGMKFHHLTDVHLTADAVSGALIVFALYVVSYVTGALVGLAYGYPAREALFESISATANVGLSAGITSPAMPAGLKITYILQMWTGRLEFVAVLAMVASLVASVRSRARRGRA
ncbi:MAG: TrkH family potassium uptake protein [Coriobacteriia bacterium]|nr:TrkH family potassium uptake protein [Coriobacteriia bacterium]